MPNQEELKDILARVLPSIRLSGTTVFINLLMVIGVRLLKLLPKLNQQLYEISLALFIWLISAFFLDFLVKKSKTASRINNLYFSYIIENILLLNWIVFNVGGVEWVGAIFYLFPIIYGNTLLSIKKGRIINILAGLNYTLLVILQYFNIIPFREFFSVPSNLHQDPIYLSVTLPFIFFAFYAVGWAIGIFTELLQKRTSELEKARLEIEEARQVLEIKVKAKTRELRELAEQREKTIEERTKELKEKIEEMEKFQKLAVGRELKMVELKRKIKELESK